MARPAQRLQIAEVVRVASPIPVDVVALKPTAPPAPPAPPAVALEYLPPDLPPAGGDQCRMAVAHVLQYRLEGIIRQD